MKQKSPVSYETPMLKAAVDRHFGIVRRNRATLQPGSPVAGKPSALEEAIAKQHGFANAAAMQRQFAINRAKA